MLGNRLSSNEGVFEEIYKPDEYSVMSILLSEIPRTEIIASAEELDVSKHAISAIIFIHLNCKYTEKKPYDMIAGLLKIIILLHYPRRRSITKPRAHRPARVANVDGSGTAATVPEAPAEPEL